jgi:hypothetical protein
MNLPAKKKCRCCRKTRPLDQFHRLQGVAAVHPFCRPCLTESVRQRIARRGARHAASTRCCAQCGQDLPVQMFHWLKASGSYHSYCRPCHATYMAERYRRNRAEQRR